MVTAGVYLIARMDGLFAAVPQVRYLVGVVGAVTLLLAGARALAQRDIKRVLAYSTISQIGYMFLALGVGAVDAAVFHFFTHAIFKALLFLAAGVVILRLHHTQDLFQMGGLWRKMPVTFLVFLAGALAITSLPPATAGLSKERILHAVHEAQGGQLLWLAGLAGVLLTSLYTFRLIFLAFLGRPRHQHAETLGLAKEIPMFLPLFLLMIGCFFAGGRPVTWLEVIGESWPAVTLAAVGAVAMFVVYVLRPAWAESIVAGGVGAKLHRFLLGGCGFDWLYGRLFVRPFQRAAELVKADPADVPYTAAANISQLAHFVLSRSQNGRVRWYAAGLVFGAVVVIAIVVLT